MARFPHPDCRTPSECRREGICFDYWNCISRVIDEVTGVNDLPADKPRSYLEERRAEEAARRR